MSSLLKLKIIKFFFILAINSLSSAENSLVKSTEA
jgi:hypothetical protein